MDKPTSSSIPPIPTAPDHPERPPQNIPIPGEPTAKGEQHKHEYKCNKCGKVFNSKQELKIHTETDHMAVKEKNKK